MEHPLILSISRCNPESCVALKGSPAGTTPEAKSDLVRRSPTCGYGRRILLPRRSRSKIAHKAQCRPDCDVKSLVGGRTRSRTQKYANLYPQAEKEVASGRGTLESSKAGKRLTSDGDTAKPPGKAPESRVAVKPPLVFDAKTAEKERPTKPSESTLGGTGMKVIDWARVAYVSVLSVTAKMNGYTPTVDDVPDTAPVELLSVKPGGNEPDSRDTVYGGTPPEMEIEDVYGDPTTPFAAVPETEIVPWHARLNCPVTELPPASVTRMEKLYIPGVLGLPTICPEMPSRTRLLGRDPKPSPTSKGEHHHAPTRSKSIALPRKQLEVAMWRVM